MIELHKSIDDIEKFEKLKAILDAYKLEYKLINDNMFGSHIVYNNKVLNDSDLIFLLQRGV